MWRGVMDVCLVIKRRLQELGLEQKGLATAAEVTESYISQLLARKKLPPAPDRSDIYEKMAIAAASCETGAGLVEFPAAQPPGSDRSRGSRRAVSRPGASCSPPADPAAPPGAGIAAHRAAGSKTPLA